MASFSFSIPTSDQINTAAQNAQQTAQNAQDVAVQAQAAAERAQQISESVRLTQTSTSTKATSPSAPIQANKKFEIKDYAIPIAAVAVLVGIGIFMWRKN